ncbi:hypothetical protein PVAP13_3NG281941 [Panicum virgatum]|uniref:RNase H type-1 domain-containing protein n=1 Tax=Panicum virgatum TaxID=38727 RepID=A0A8T0UJH4_PANVG|nr:hypothetical protein PVAP13_3NG281941 [Panicum virgatum]
MFNGKMQLTLKDQVKAILQVENDVLDARYLGLPTLKGRMKGDRFQYLKERISKHLKNFSEKNMSSAAKEILIKSVAQALPTYIMGVFKLPLGRCDDLTSIIRNFWWGTKHGRQKTAWTAWEAMIQKKCCGGLGFKDLRLFNQAMLARQAWRLIQFPDSLCARMLKAKYFPRGSLVDTAFCSKASTTWQAIMHGLELLKQGIIWRVGNGTQIRIWRDPWIPREISLRVFSQRRCRLRWVSQLLDIEGRGWDLQKLPQIFNLADAEEIAKIKIPVRASEDFIAWHAERNGMFSVRSAYNLALRIKLGQGVQGSSSAPTGERKLWQRVWAGHVPPKVNVFIWKLAKDILPTRWAKFIRRLFRYTGPDWLLLLLDQCSDVERDLTKLLLWKAWSVHNNITHQAGPTSISEAEHALLSMQATLAEILLGGEGVKGKGKAPCSWSGKNKRLSSASKEQDRKTKWEPPPVDGSFVQQSGAAGVGVIARDSMGHVLLSAWRAILECQDAAEAEAWACLEGFWLAAQWIHEPVIVESDCIRIVQAMQAKEDRSALRFILLEVKDQARMLSEWRMAKVKRECNLVANELAQLARRNMHSAVWLRRVPACVDDFVKNDCTPPN